VAAYYLAKAGKNVTVFERKLSVGGGMWGGGMMFDRIVVQDEGKPFWVSSRSGRRNTQMAIT
jgi:sulfide-dependent adenosine diphosphate thiazole synthase